MGIEEKIGSSFHPLGMFFMLVFLVYGLYVFIQKGSQYGRKPIWRGFRIGIYFLILQIFAYLAGWINTFPVDNNYIGVLIIHGSLLLYLGLKKFLTFLLSKEEASVKIDKITYIALICMMLFIPILACIAFGIKIYTNIFY